MRASEQLISELGSQSQGTVWAARTREDEDVKVLRTTNLWMRRYADEDKDEKKGVPSCALWRGDHLM